MVPSVSFHSATIADAAAGSSFRSEEHTSELQSRVELVCRLLLEKKKAIEYRRFYVRDLESIVVWPSRLWMWRLVISVFMFAARAFEISQCVDSTIGAILCLSGYT